MRVGALICGILGGLIALIIGFFGSALSGLAGQLGWVHGQFFQIVLIALPVAGIVGGGVSLTVPLLGAALMGACTAGVYLLFGLNALSIVPLALTGVGTILAFLGGLTETNEARQAEPTRQDPEWHE